MVGAKHCWIVQCNYVTCYAVTKKNKQKKKNKNSLAVKKGESKKMQVTEYWASQRSDIKIRPRNISSLSHPKKQVGCEKGKTQSIQDTQNDTNM